IHRCIGGVVGSAEARLIDRIDREAGIGQRPDILLPGDAGADARRITMDKDERRTRAQGEIESLNTIDLDEFFRRFAHGQTGAATRVSTRSCVGSTISLFFAASRSVPFGSRPAFTASISRR